MRYEILRYREQLRYDFRLHAMMPSTVEATLVQGASFVFKGKEVLLEHYDASSGAHVSVDELLEIALLK